MRTVALVAGLDYRLIALMNVDEMKLQRLGSVEDCLTFGELQLDLFDGLLAIPFDPTSRRDSAYGRNKPSKQ